MAFQGTYLRLSKAVDPGPTAVVNCQIGAGEFERFRLETPPEMPRIRVLSYNTHLMQGSFISDGIDLERFAIGINTACDISAAVSPTSFTRSAKTTALTMKAADSIGRFWRVRVETGNPVAPVIWLPPAHRELWLFRIVCTFSTGTTRAMQFFTPPVGSVIK
jgi:hypothetical protein